MVVSFFSLVLFFAATPVLAQAPNDNSQIPEKNGDYQDPGHPGIRVRVFVHEPKERLGSAQSSILICSQPDPDSSAVIPSAGWHLPSTWTYRVNTSSAPLTVGASQLSTIANSSFNAWSLAILGKVAFTRGANTRTDRKGLDGQNIVAWGRTSGSALAVTYTWYYPSSGLVAEVDTIMNKKFPWSWSGNNGGCANSGSYDAQDILTHELGHWMGLDDTYDTAFTDNTMFGYGSKGEIKKDTLTTGDITGVQNIYP